MVLKWLLFLKAVGVIFAVCVAVVSVDLQCLLCTTSQNMHTRVGM